jgi:hypothetical protein
MSAHDRPVAANVLARQFDADRPNQRWVGDSTEFVIAAVVKANMPFEAVYRTPTRIQHQNTTSVHP